MQYYVLLAKSKMSRPVTVIITAAAFLSMTSSFNFTNAEPVTMDINKAKDPGPGFGEEKIGTLSVEFK